MLQKFYNDTTRYEARQARAFENHFGLQKPLLKIPFKPGVSGDYEIQPEGGSKKYAFLFWLSI